MLSTMEDQTSKRVKIKGLENEQQAVPQQPLRKIVVAESNLLQKIQKRKKIEDLFSPEVIKKKEKMREFSELPQFFDRVYFFFLTRKVGSVEVNGLVKSLAECSLNKSLTEKTAYRQIQLLAANLPEFCNLKEVHGVSRFNLVYRAAKSPSTPSLKELKEKVKEISKQLLSEYLLTQNKTTNSGLSQTEEASIKNNVE